MKNRLFVLLSLITLLVIGACAAGPEQDQSDGLSSSDVSGQAEAVQVAATQTEPPPAITTQEVMAETKTPAIPETVEGIAVSPEAPPPTAEAPTSEPVPAEPSVDEAENEPAVAEPSIILQGQFQDADEVHTGTGTATIHQRPDGSYLLTFEEFEVCCGPELYVFLASNPAPTGHADLGDYLELSSLQASRGHQEYEIPAGTDLSDTKSVVIYCKPFEVIISTATLG